MDSNQILNQFSNRILSFNNSCFTNFSFYLGASNTNLNELEAIDSKNVCGIKLFLGSSTGNLIVDSSEQIEKIFKSVQVPLALHCEVSVFHRT